MKAKFNILFLAIIALLSVGVSSCSDDDDFTPTIFDTTDYPLDKSSYTFALDTFCKVNFLEPYNLHFNYKFEDMGSDMNKNLTPAAYDKSVDLAVLTKYLWYDVYKSVAGEAFLKEYSPRIISITGSKNFNASQGTETLGDASSGVKINLYNVNNLNVADIDLMNKYFFQTMHHEFAHILDQSHLRPTAFNTVSSGHYDAANWSETPDSISVGLGFVSPYASSAVTEDWAETMASYITFDTVRWSNLLRSADFDWEQIDYKSDDYKAEEASYYSARPKTTNVTHNQETGKNDTTYTFNSAKDSVYYILRTHGESVGDVVGYLHKLNNGNYKLYRKVVSRNADGLPLPSTSGKLQFLNQDGLDGRDIILRKVEYVRSYLKSYYNIDLDKLRNEVQVREYLTNADGSILIQNGATVNRLNSPVTGYATLMDSLRQEVYKYNSLKQ